MTRGELWQRVTGLTQELRTAGVEAGDCVAVWLPNRSDTLVWQFAVATRGTHVIGINTRYNLAEAAHVLDGARPRLVALATDFHGLDLLGRLRDAVAASSTPVPAVALVPGPGRRIPPAAEVAAADVGGGSWVPGTVDRTQPLPLRPTEHPARSYTTPGPRLRRE